ncbi:MAG: hypothetical protein KF901_14705 [Myxococcales bacterium]|nr:hypothetical protein [Myxococcales bacterium]
MDYELAAASPSVSVRCSFEGDGVVVIEERSKRRTHVPFSEIRTVRVRQTLGAYVMRIEATSTRPVTLRSRRVVGTRVEDRVADYAAVLERLHALHRSHPEIRFLGGSSGLYWLGWALVPTSLAMGGLAAWMIFAGDAPLRLWVSLVVVTALGLVAGSAGIRQGRARPYDPDAPPRDLVPS